MKVNSGNENTIVAELWTVTGCLGGWNVEVESFLVEVARRDAATLLPLVAAHLRPGSIVYSNERSAYNQLAATTGNIHNTVNHSLHFVDPVTGVHTLEVEGMCKRMLRKENTMHSSLFETYLPKYMA